MKHSVKMATIVQQGLCVFCLLLISFSPFLFNCNSLNDILSNCRRIFLQPKFIWTLLLRIDFTCLEYILRTIILVVSFCLILFPRNNNNKIGSLLIVSLCGLFLIIAAFWLTFVKYILRHPDNMIYKKLRLKFTNAFLDVLYCYLLLTIIILYRFFKRSEDSFIYLKEPVYIYVRVLRSPDGFSKHYIIKDDSCNIHDIAQYIINSYMVDFPMCPQQLLSKNNAMKENIQSYISEKNISINSNKYVRYGQNERVQSCQDDKTAFKMYNLENSPIDDNENDNDDLKHKRNVNSLRCSHLTINDDWQSKISSYKGTTNHYQTNASTVAYSIGQSEQPLNNQPWVECNFNDHRFVERQRKRYQKLLQITEDAFKHIRRRSNIQLDNDENVFLTAAEASQAVFVTISRPLQKYLKKNKTQAYFSRQSVLDDINDCLRYDISPRAFLQRYLAIGPSCFAAPPSSSSSSIQRSNVNSNQFQNSNKKSTFSKNKRRFGRSLMPCRSANSCTNCFPLSYSLSSKTTASLQAINAIEDCRTSCWTLVCDRNELWTRQNDARVVFVLRNENVSILCQCKRAPQLNLIESFYSQNDLKFVFNVNSETSV